MRSSGCRDHDAAQQSKADTTISSRASSPESCGLCLEDFKGQFSASATEAAENLSIGIIEFQTGVPSTRYVQLSSAWW
jgi:hypothetical protein